MLKKFPLLMVAMIAASLMAGGAAFAEKEYVNGIDADFSPFAYVDENGSPAGFDVDAVNWMAEKLGFKVTHKPMAWSGVVASLQMKKIDFIASGLSITEERARKINYTIPYWTIKRVLVVEKDSTLTVEDIKAGGKALGVQSGAPEAGWIEKQIGNGRFNVELRMYDSAPLAVEDVLNGRIAAAAMDDAPAFDAVRKKNVKVLGAFGMPPEKIGYGVNKADTELKELLNKGLKMLMADPYWQKLVDKYKPGRH